MSKKEISRRLYGNYVAVIIGRLKKVRRKRWVRRAESQAVGRDSKGTGGK